MAKIDNIELYDKIEANLFHEDKKLKLNAKEEAIKKRWQAVFTHWLDNPTLSDKQIRNYIQDEFNLEKTQAYRDIHYIKILLGNVTNASKQWQRYKLINMLDQAFEVAKTKKNAIAMVMAADKLGKYTQLDKEDSLQIPWEEIVPQVFEPTTDPTSIGLEPDPDINQKVEKMKRKYIGQITISDAKIIKDE